MLPYIKSKEHFTLYCIEIFKFYKVNLLIFKVERLFLFTLKKSIQKWKWTRIVPLDIIYFNTSGSK